MLGETACHTGRLHLSHRHETSLLCRATRFSIQSPVEGQEPPTKDCTRQRTIGLCVFFFFFFTVYFEACVHVAEVKLLGFIFSQTDRSRNSKEDVIVVFPPKDGRDILGLTERRRSTVRAGGEDASEPPWAV